MDAETDALQTRTESFNKGNTIPCTLEMAIWSPHDGFIRQVPESLWHILGAVKKFPEYFGSYGLVYNEFLPSGQDDSGHLYVQVLQRLRDATSGRQGQWFLHHDNTPIHTSLVVHEFHAEKNILVVT
jgi:hypothetical protein